LNSILAVAATGAITSHQVIATDQKNLKGTMVLSNTDKDSLTKNKDELSNTLTQNLQADAKNANSNVKVNEVKELSDGTFALDYECTGVSDQETAKKTLNKAVKQDDVKKTIVKSSKNGATTAKAEQKATNPQSEFYL
jgi:pimeloyl-CoA synthetase